jgi:hypothetical protein
MSHRMKGYTFFFTFADTLVVCLAYFSWAFAPAGFQNPWMTKGTRHEENDMNIGKTLAVTAASGILVGLLAACGGESTTTTTPTSAGSAAPEGSAGKTSCSGAGGGAKTSCNGGGAATTPAKN